MTAGCLRKQILFLCGLSLVLAQTLVGARPGHAEGVNEAALLAAKPAPYLSAYGLFRDPVSMIPSAGVVPYEMTTPLFTDYAVKRRFVYVPKGQAARYDDTEAFAFPVGTVLIKSFGYPADFAEPDKNMRFIETRLLIHQEDGWLALPYVWDADMTDAKLKVAGARQNIDVVLPDGSAQAINYAVPNKNQCKGCHAIDDAVTPIGPKARHLNRDYIYDAGTNNQLSAWESFGILSGVPDSTKWPRSAVWDDATSGSLDERARAYLDINCAHCHRVRGPADNSGLFLSAHEQNMRAFGIWKRPAAAGLGTGGRNFDINPGVPDDSILLFRMETQEPGLLMPELGRSLQHTEGVALIREWIMSLPETDQPRLP